MAKTQQRPGGAARLNRSGTAAGRTARTARGTTAPTGGRFARTPSSGRSGRPAPARKPRSSSPLGKLPFVGSGSPKPSGGVGGLLSGLTGALGTSGSKARSGGGMGKAGGLAALAGLAGLAAKNRSKLPGKLGGGRQDDGEVVTVGSPPTATRS